MQAKTKWGGGRGDKIKPPKNPICMFVPSQACILQLLPQIHCLQAQKSALIQTFGLKWGLGYCGLHFLLFTFLVLHYLFISVSRFHVYYLLFPFFKFDACGAMPIYFNGLDSSLRPNKLKLQNEKASHGVSTFLQEHRHKLSTGGDGFRWVRTTCPQILISPWISPTLYWKQGYHHEVLTGGGADSVLSNPPTTKLFSPWILATLFWKSWIM